MLILLWGNPNYIRIILNVNIVVKRINTILDCYDKIELFVLDIFMLLRMILEGVIRSVYHHNYIWRFKDSID